jgi:hypothetical protein
MRVRLPSREPLGALWFATDTLCFQCGLLVLRHDDAPRLDPVRPDEAGGNVRIFVGKPSCRLCRAEHDGGAVRRVAQRACDHEITCIVGRSHSRQVRFAMRRPTLDHIWHVVIEESEELVHLARDHCSDRGGGKRAAAMPHAAPS